MRKKEMQNLLAERSERAMVLETRIDSLEKQIEAYRAREQSVMDSLAGAQVSCNQRIAEADARARQIVEEAQRKTAAAIAQAEANADATLQEAEEQANKLRKQAQTQADELLRNANNARTQILARSEAAVAEYQERIGRYNVALVKSAADARSAAEQFATFCGTCTVNAAESEIFGDEGATRAGGYVAADKLPNPDDSPAQLMQNIYKLQNRDLAETAAVLGQAASAPESQPETDQMMDFAPRPEDAYADETTDRYGEPYVPEAEWQPEADLPQTESEGESATPTVSELMPDFSDEDELSLDALLDEIIKAGE
ncbi:MAG: hypothetical protein RRZ24_08645 [Clostridia bacterium]